MAVNAQRNLTDVGNIPGLGGEDEYEFNNANGTVVLAGDGFPQRHTGPNNGEAESDHFVRVLEQTNSHQEADPSENQSSEHNSTNEATVTDSKNQSQDNQDMLDAAKKRTREVELKLRKTEEDLIAESTRANNAESEVQYLLSKIEEWKAWAKQQRQVQQSSKNSRKTEATVADLKKQLKDTKQKLDAFKENEKTEAIVANLKKQLQETQEKLDVSKERASVVESKLRKTEEELITETVRANRAEAKVLDLSKAN